MNRVSSLCRLLILECLLISSFFAALINCSASPSLEIHDMMITENEVELGFILTDSQSATPVFTIEYSTDFSLPDSWREISSTIESLGGGLYRVKGPRPAGSNVYFRIRGSGLGDTVIYSDITASLLEGTPGRPVIHFDQPFTGRIDYSYTLNGVTQSGTAFANAATQLEIPVSLPQDDDQILPQAFIRLSVSSPDSGLSIAEPVVLLPIAENDERWEGALDGAYGAPIPFTLEILRQGNVTFARFLSPGAGPFPAGITYPVGNLVLPPAALAFSVQTTVPAKKGTFIRSESKIALTLQQSGPQTDDEISGVYTLLETFSTEPQLSPPMAHGTFELRRHILPPAETKVVLESAP